MLTIMDMGTGMLGSKSGDEEYSQEILRVEWNPVVATLQAVADELAGELIGRNAMPADLREADIEGFLRKMYAAQQ
ncbi:MAG: hypothetical protein KGZ83_04665 [Sulfuricella sp.]|nr:hypothetical protein [Sulfuricella sp.]